MRKKEKSQIIIIGVLAIALALSACGKDKPDDQLAAVSEGQSDNVSNQNDMAAIEDETEQSIANSEVTVDEEAVSMERYEKFLAGTEKVSISKIDFSEYNYGEHVMKLKSDKEYTIDEFFASFFEDMLAYYEQNYSVSEINYGYVDCGRDDRKELVLQFTAHMYNDEYNNIMLIKDVNGKLELCAWVGDGARCYNYITIDGVIARGGSGGASVWYDSYNGIDENGDYFLIYELESCSASDLYFDDVNYGEIASNLRVDDIAIRRYSFDGYNEAEYDDASYTKYMQECYYTYEVYDDNYEIVQSEKFYEPNSNYGKFMSLVTDNWHKPSDMQSILTKKLSEKGISEDMLSGEYSDWIKWEGHDELFEVMKYEVPCIRVDNPSWTYYSNPFPYEQREDFVTFDEISHVANDIIDDAEWFDEIGVYMYDPSEFNDPSGQYTYYLTSTNGDYDHQYDTVRIFDNWMGRDIVTLDFYNFIIPDEYMVGDAGFVRECVEYVQIVDDVLYVSIAHRTYASSAPHNAYVMALDMNEDYRVIWKSEPLVCNSSNFAIVDGSLICGYGFTDEPDYVYELNRYTGEKMNTVKVKTGPDYFYAIDGKLYVRTYDTNYVFQLSWG